MTKNPYWLIPDLECNTEKELLSWRHALFAVKQGVFESPEHYFWKTVDVQPAKEEAKELLDERGGNIVQMNNRHLFRGKRVDNGEWVTGTPRKQKDKIYILPFDYDIIFDRPDYPALGCGVEDIGYQKNGYKAAEYGFDEGLERYEEMFPVWVEIDPATVSQCTGLIAAKSYRGESEKDRLIFEGDILSSDEIKKFCSCPDDLPIAIVKWSDAKGCWYGDLITSCYDLQASSFYKHEIIGNIHDNPELLEVGND